MVSALIFLCSVEKAIAAARPDQTFSFRRLIDFARVEFSLYWSSGAGEPSAQRWVRFKQIPGRPGAGGLILECRNHHSLSADSAPLVFFLNPSNAEAWSRSAAEFALLEHPGTVSRPTIDRLAVRLAPSPGDHPPKESPAGTDLPASAGWDAAEPGSVLTPASAAS